mmetsp:Transcript_10290/g.18604  ORF Transcript_10290/g.18604 Transcript_10290/m.18604 type:complete len:220 (+) Transcript_10290:2167-2826(+)
MVQDVQLQTFDAAHGLVVQEPVNSDHVLPSRLAYGESRPDLDRLLEFFRLPLDLGGVRFRTVLGSVVVQVGGEEIEPLRLIVVAVEEDLGVAGVVLLLPELTEVVEGEVGNVEGVTSAVSSVHVVGEEAPLGLSAAEAVGAGVDTFHLVVHYAFVRELPVLVLEMPSLLSVYVGVLNAAGEEDGVEVYVDEVLEVLGVLGGYGVTGSVGVGERVEEGVY